MVYLRLPLKPKASVLEKNMPLGFCNAKLR
jgi:hypothetical protein